MEHMENIGPHYARTLRIWRQTFLANFGKLLANYPKTMPRSSSFLESIPLVGSIVTENQYNVELLAADKKPFYSEEFKRKWTYYFSYCEAGFATRTLGNVQMVLTRECNPSLVEKVKEFAI